MVDVVEAQRERIRVLEAAQKKLCVELGDKIDIISNLSHVLAYLTDGAFKEFASKTNWNRVIVDYSESN